MNSAMKRLILSVFLVAIANAQQNALMLPWTPQQFSNTNGTVLANGKVCTYQAGTSTGLATFTDSTAAVSSNVPPNAILLDSTGRPTSCGIWLSAAKSYKIIVLTAGSDSTCNTGVTIKTQDNVTASNVAANNTFTGVNTFTQLEGCQHVNASQSFAGALAIGGVTCIAIDPGTYTVSANATVPASVGLQFTKGGILSIATGVTLTIQSPIYASPDAAIFAYVGSGTTVISGNNGVISSAWFPGADICAQINTAIKAMTVHGAVIDARHYASGNQACGTNMFSGVTVGGQLLLGVYTIQTTVSQVTATKFQIEGAGRGDSGSFGTVIQAVAGFPTTTVPVIQWASAAFGARWRNVSVDCNNITNAIGVQNLQGEEETGFSYGIIRDCPGGELDVETSSAQNSGPWDNLEIVSTNLCTNCGASSFPVTFNNAVPSRGLKSTTINVTGVGTPPTALMRVSSNAFSAEDINLENAPAGDGILLASLGGAAGIVLKNITCFNLTTCVHVSALQTGGNITMFGVSSTGSVTNLVKDDTTGRTVTQAAQQSGKLGWYMIGEGSRTSTAPVITDALAVPTGVAYVPCNTSQKTETAADANLLTCAIPAQAGSYRVRFVLSLSAANAATLGWTATWTDSNGNAQTPTNLSLFQEGTGTPATTFVTSAAGNYYGYADVDVNNAGTSVVVKLTFSGTSFTGKASATVERII